MLRALLKSLGCIGSPKVPLIAVLLLLLVSTSAQAQDPQEIKELLKPSYAKDVSFLYPAGKIYNYEKLFPLVIQVKNASPAKRVYQFQWNENGVKVPEELKDLILEPGETRQFSIVFPKGTISGLYNFRVNKESISPEVRAGNKNLTVGILSPPEQGFEYIRSLKLQEVKNYSAKPEDPVEYQILNDVTKLDSQVCPTSWAALAGVDLIIAHDLQALTLSNMQQEALVQWTQMGGRLVLVSNGLPEEYRGTALESILPLTPSQAKNSKGLLYIEGESRVGATIRHETGFPLLLSRKVKNGDIWLFTSPLTEIEPLGQEKLEMIWKKVIEGFDTSNHQANATFKSFPANTNIPMGNLREIPELPRAQAGWLAIFLISYAILVGPVNLGILRKRDKMLWAFMTVPVIAILFAGSAYIINMSNRSSIPVLRELGWATTESGDPVLATASEMILFSPSSRTYQLKGSAGSEYLIPQSHSYRQTNNSFGLYRWNSEGGLDSQVELGTWDVLQFGSRNLVSLDKPIKVEYQDGQVTIETPIGCETGQALIDHPQKGLSQTLELKTGNQTFDLKFNAAPGYNRYSVLGVNTPEHPGREQLVNNLANQTGGLTNPKKGHLLFWTDEIKSPVEVNHDAVHRSEQLIIVEFDL